MNQQTAAAELRDLADLVSRLPAPSRHDPEAFHENRSEVASAMLGLAARLDGANGRHGRTPTTPRRVKLSYPSELIVNGRRVIVQTRRAAFAVSRGS